MPTSNDARSSSNGGRRSQFVLAAAAGAPGGYDPMSKVLALDEKTSSVAAWFGFMSSGTLLMVGLMALVLVVAWLRSIHALPLADETEEIEVVKEELPPPPPPPQAEPEQKPEPAPPPRALPHEPPPPAAAPAQAAKVLTAEPDPNDPVDLTGNTIVTGNADYYAGGVTAANGTSKNAVTGVTSPHGVPGGTGSAVAPPPPGPDRSRPPSLAGGAQWNCPFPPESDSAQIDEAYVTVQIDVRADGSPGAVRVVSDAGNGFGREARQCAMGKRYQTALDHDGNAIPGSFKVKVHFSR
jgi:protein TonB